MIRRPVLFAAISFAAGIFCRYYMSVSAAFCAALVLLILLVFSEKKRSVAVMCIILAGFTAGIIDMGIDDRIYKNAASVPEQRCSVSGTVCNVEERTDENGEKYRKITLKTDSLGDVKLHEKTKILITDRTRKQQIIPGYEVTTVGNPALPAVKSNPGCFDYRQYLRSCGVTHIMDAEALDVTNYKDTFRGRLFIMRENFINRLSGTAGEKTAAMINGILFGFENGMDEDTLETFRKNGTAHILAVSGLHAGIIYGVISKLWIWRKGRIYFVSVITFFVCYVILADFSPSVVRASVMIGLHIFANLTNRRYDLGCSALAVLTVMLAFEPVKLFNAGFQMTFIAVLTLSVFIKYINSFYTGIFAAGAAVQLGLGPFIAYTFNCFSPAAVIVNIPVIFLAGIIVPSGMLMFIFCMVTGDVFSPVCKFIDVSCLLMERLNEFTCIENITVFNVTSPSPQLLFIYYTVILLFLSEEGRLMILRKKRKTAALLSVAAVCMSFIFAYTIEDNFKDIDIVFVDVGQGDCMHIRTETGSYLIDGGGSERKNTGKKTLMPYLLKNGTRKVEGAFVTHLHTDHYKGIAELAREGMIKKLYVSEHCRGSEENIINETGLDRDDIIYLKKGDGVEISEEVRIRILWPETSSGRVSEDDENSSSLIMITEFHTEAGGVFRMTATGDVDEACQNQLAEIYGKKLETDILKVSHHGSRYSYSKLFTEYSSPSYAVFQVGRNNYGHPNEEVIENYKEKGAEIFRNDTDGAVGFRIKENGEVDTVKMKGE